MAFVKMVVPARNLPFVTMAPTALIVGIDLKSSTVALWPAVISALSRRMACVMTVAKVPRLVFAAWARTVQIAVADT